MAMDVDQGPTPRVFCPVGTCPCSDRARASGWADLSTMHAHIDAHLAGTLAGDVPADWMRAHHRQRCPVCGLSVSTRYGTHPSCRPLARAGAPAGNDHRRDAGATLPSFSDIQAGQATTLRHIPAAARHLWTQVLTRVLASAAHHNDVKAWKELLMLPQSVLCAPPRGGRKHKRATAAFTVDRLHRWQEGEWLSLCDSRPSPPRSHKQMSADDRQSLAIALAREGLEGKACNALLSMGLAPVTADTVRELQTLHPTGLPPHISAMTALPPAPDLPPDLVAKSLRSFPAGSAPGPSGLRPQHVLEACPPGMEHGVAGPAHGGHGALG